MVFLYTGTSGDTGSAAIEAVRGFEWVDIIVLLPRGRCSNIQEKQMTTVLEDNVHVYRGKTCALLVSIISYTCDGTMKIQIILCISTF